MNKARRVLDALTAQCKPHSLRMTEDPDTQYMKRVFDLKWTDNNEMFQRTSEAFAELWTTARNGNKATRGQEAAFRRAIAEQLVATLEIANTFGLDLDKDVSQLIIEATLEADCYVAPRS